MKSLSSICLTLCGAALVVAVVAPTPTIGQAVLTDGDAATAALIVELGAQQTLLAENQIKIDAKIAVIAEDVRQARLFVARGGGKAATTK